MRKAPAPSTSTVTRRPSTLGSLPVKFFRGGSPIGPKVFTLTFCPMHPLKCSGLRERPVEPGAGDLQVVLVGDEVLDVERGVDRVRDLAAVLQAHSAARLVDEQPQDPALALAHVLDLHELQPFGSDEGLRERRGAFSSIVCLSALAIESRPQKEKWAPRPTFRGTTEKCRARSYHTRRRCKGRRSSGQCQSTGARHIPGEFRPDARYNAPMLLIAAVQMTSGPTRRRTWTPPPGWSGRRPALGARLVGLPENFSWMGAGGRARRRRRGAGRARRSPAWPQLARELQHHACSPARSWRRARRAAGSTTPACSSGPTASGWRSTGRSTSSTWRWATGPTYRESAAVAPGHGGGGRPRPRLGQARPVRLLRPALPRALPAAARRRARRCSPSPPPSR